MNGFFNALTFAKEKIYEPNNLNVKFAEEERQNYKYGAGKFEVSGRTVRFRVAHITPTKIGQFVAMWKKDKTNKNQAFSVEGAPDLLVIMTIKNKTEWGSIYFSKTSSSKATDFKNESNKRAYGDTCLSKLG